MFYFQDIIRELENFWKEQGCSLLMPYDIEVGAATLSPYTILEVLKKETWKVCYTQYCRRPTDGRDGDSSNRLSGYYQFQVILKPFAKDVQGAYLKSLSALGISNETHDIRFIEDNWENPSIGASGVGYEVCINGMECSQWTYMQQIGGVPLKTTPCEISYGLERVAMYIQKVENIFDLQWSKDIKYSDLFLEREKESSTYYKSIANTKAFSKEFEFYLEEGEKAIEHNLSYPAYELCIKASHALNIMDARNALSQTERAGLILRIRELVSQICTKITQTT